MSENAKSFFFYIPILAIVWPYFRKNEQLSIFVVDCKKHPFLTIFIAVLGTCAEMERENIKYRLNSGKEKYIAKGEKVGRKAGYRKSGEKLQDEYAGVINQLWKGYPICLVAKSDGVGVSTVQRRKNILGIISFLI